MFLEELRFKEMVAGDLEQYTLGGVRVTETHKPEDKYLKVSLLDANLSNEDDALNLLMKLEIENKHKGNGILGLFIADFMASVVGKEKFKDGQDVEIYNKGDKFIFTLFGKYYLVEYV